MTRSFSLIDQGTS